MTQHLPEWIMRRYAKLWIKYKNRNFTKEDAEKVIGKKASAVFLSDLRKAGWASIEVDQNNARKFIYTLKDPKLAIMEELKELSK